MIIGSKSGFMGGGASSIVKSIQQVTITIPTSGTSNTATITSVDTANSICFYNGKNGTSTTNNYGKDSPAVELTNSTTVTAKRFIADASYTVTVNATVVEFETGVVKSVQTGIINMTGVSSNTATISSVNTANSFVAWGGETNNFDGVVTTPWNASTHLFLTNSTTVTATRGTNVTNPYSYFTVVEFEAGILNSSTQAFSTLPTNQTISSVDVDQTMIVFGGHKNSSSANNVQILPRVELTSSTNVSVVQYSGSTATTSFTVVEFAPDTLKSVQRGTAVLGAAETTHNTTITSVNTDKAFANFLGDGGASSSNAMTGNFSKMKLTSSTNLETSRNSTTTALNTNYEVIEFN